MVEGLLPLGPWGGKNHAQITRFSGNCHYQQKRPLAASLILSATGTAYFRRRGHDLDGRTYQTGVLRKLRNSDKLQYQSIDYQNR